MMKLRRERFFNCKAEPVQLGADPEERMENLFYSPYLHSLLEVNLDPQKSKVRRLPHN